MSGCVIWAMYKLSNCIFVDMESFHTKFKNHHDFHEIHVAYANNLVKGVKSVEHININ